MKFNIIRIEEEHLDFSKYNYPPKNYKEPKEAIYIVNDNIYSLIMNIGKPDTFKFQLNNKEYTNIKLSLLEISKNWTNKYTEEQYKSTLEYTKFEFEEKDCIHFKFRDKNKDIYNYLMIMPSLSSNKQYPKTMHNVPIGDGFHCPKDWFLDEET